MKRTIMKTDAQLKTDVTNELEWDPAINATHVGVAVTGGVVTLTGHLETFAEKYAIERAVGRVEGVKAVAIELDVKLAPGHKRSDSEIAEAAETAFKWHSLIPGDRIQVKVEKGRVTLAGELDWAYQRTAAEKAVRSLTGVVGVINNLRLKPSVAPANISNRIRAPCRARSQEHRGDRERLDRHAAWPGRFAGRAGGGPRRGLGRPRHQPGRQRPDGRTGRLSRCGR